MGAICQPVSTFSRRSRSLSILYNGTPAFKKSYTTCARNARTFKGKVQVCNRQLAFSAFNASVMVTYGFLAEGLFVDLDYFGEGNGRGVEGELLWAGTSYIFGIILMKSLKTFRLREEYLHAELPKKSFQQSLNQGLIASLYH